MATRRYKISPGATQVTEEAGAAVNSDTVELTVELANTEINIGGSTTRTVSKLEVLEAIDKIKKHIVEHQWPPA